MLVIFTQAYSKEETVTKHITVIVRKRTTLEQAQKILVSALGHGGCPQCYSGLKITFEDAVDPESAVFVTDKNNLGVGPIASEAAV
jgi:hypothetical protein